MNKCALVHAGFKMSVISLNSFLQMREPNSPLLKCDQYLKMHFSQVDCSTLMGLPRLDHKKDSFHPDNGQITHPREASYHVMRTLKQPFVKVHIIRNGPPANRKHSLGSHLHQPPCKWVLLRDHVPELPSQVTPEMLAH